MKFKTIFLLFFCISVFAFGGELYNGRLEPSWSIPVISINTENGDSIKSKDYYIPAILTLFEADSTVVGDYDIEIKGRGNHTWRDFEKKPYKLKFKKKISLVGDNESKHYALLAFCGPWAYWNNLVGFEISKRIGLDWTPSMKPVELVLNGDYQGLYFLVENIRIERGRVNITEQKDNEEDESKVSGGWLLEIDNYKNEKQIELYDGEGKLIKITYHSPEQLSQVQYDYLTVFLNDINNSIKDYNKNPTGWEDYIDIDELTKFYIVQEIMENPEAFCGSCWMHKDYGDDAKLKFGPIWDLEAGFYYRDTPNFIIDPIVEGYKYKQRWITEIIDSPRLQYRIKKLWNDFCDKTLIDDFVYNSYYEIYDAIQKDHIRWPQYNNSYTEESLSLFLERYTNKNIFFT